MKPRIGIHPQWLLRAYRIHPTFLKGPLGVMRGELQVSNALASFAWTCLKRQWRDASGIREYIGDRMVRSSRRSLTEQSLGDCRTVVRRFYWWVRSCAIRPSRDLGFTLEFRFSGRLLSFGN